MAAASPSTHCLASHCEAQSWVAGARPAGCLAVPSTIPPTNAASTRPQLRASIQARSRPLRGMVTSIFRTHCTPSSARWATILRLRGPATDASPVTPWGNPFPDIGFHYELSRPRALIVEPMVTSHFAEGRRLDGRAKGLVGRTVAGGQPGSAQLRDLSLGGAAVLGEWRLPAGQETELELPNGGGVVSARVVRCEAGFLSVVFRQDGTTADCVGLAIEALDRQRNAA
jgi:PilZ domain